MTIYFSAETLGFYDDSVHSFDQIPARVRVITKERWGELMTAQSQGREIKANAQGYPIAVIPTHTFKQAEPNMANNEPPLPIDSIDAEFARMKEPEDKLQQSLPDEASQKSVEEKKKDDMDDEIKNLL
jgi:hypothetical protein